MVITYLGFPRLCPVVLMVCMSFYNSAAVFLLNIDLGTLYQLNTRFTLYKDKSIYLKRFHRKNYLGEK